MRTEKYNEIPSNVQNAHFSERDIITVLPFHAHVGAISVKENDEHRMNNSTSYDIGRPHFAPQAAHSRRVN